MDEKPTENWWTEQNKIFLHITENEKSEEIELELKCGLRADLFALAQHILQHANTRLGYLSKAARGYMLCDHNPLQVDEGLGYVPLRPSNVSVLRF